MQVTDVQAVLGVTDTKLSKICTAPNINKWAVYKPFRHTTLGMATLEDRRQSDNGFAVVEYSSVDEALAGAIKGADAWAYLPPFGTATSPYRLGDYSGYVHDAISWFTFYAGSDNGYDIRFASDGDGIISLPGRFISFEFLTKATEMPSYIGFLIWKTDSAGNITSAVACLTSAYSDVDELSSALVLNHASVRAQIGSGAVLVSLVLFRPNMQITSLPYYINRKDGSSGVFYVLPAQPVQVTILSATEQPDKPVGVSVELVPGTGSVNWVFGGMQWLCDWAFTASVCNNSDHSLQVKVAFLPDTSDVRSYSWWLQPGECQTVTESGRLMQIPDPEDTNVVEIKYTVEIPGFTKVTRELKVYNSEQTT